MEELFSRRQLQVLRLMPTHAIKEIAWKLGVSRYAINSMQQQIRQKIGTEDRTQTVVKAIGLGLIDLDSIVFPGDQGS